MSTSIIALAVLAVAITFWRPLRRVRTALRLEYLLSTGHGFLLLGVLLGLAFGNWSASGTLLARDITPDIAPIVAFVAGWVGFATGIRFEIRVLRLVPGRAFYVALMPALAAAIVVALASLGVLVAAGMPLTESLAASLVLGAAAASSGPTLAAVLRTRRAGRSPQARGMLRMVELSAGLDDAIVVLLAIVGFALFRSEPEPVYVIALLGLTLGGGGLLGVVTWLFLGGEASDDERLLLGLAMLAFIAGFAGWMLLSPAALAAIAAFVLTNLPGERSARLFQAVRRVERTAMVILMTVVGFHVAGAMSWLFVPLFIAMTAVRLAVKYLVGQQVAGPIPGTQGLSAARGWALGLVSQGNLGIMVALGFFYVWHDELARSVLAAVALASAANELLAPSLVMKALRMSASTQQMAASPDQSQHGQEGA